MVRRNVLTVMIALVVIGLLSVLGVATQSWAQGRSDWAVAHAIGVQEEHTSALMEIPGVVGTAVGINREGQLAVKVFVKRGADLARIPKTVKDVPVAVEVTGEIVALKPPAKPPRVDPTDWFPRPVPIGVSTGHPNITAGTIGCRVTDDDNNVYALSNNHVFANENHASKGDSVLQPGPYDGGQLNRDEIGTLYHFQVLMFDGSANTVDAAIALSSIVTLGTATPPDGYGTPKSTTVAPKIGMPVMKYGRTTSQTKGWVDAINATVDVSYDQGTARFVGQIIVKPGNFSAGGDSGSLIVVQKGLDARKPIGLLFAGSPYVTVANPIDLVLGALHVTVDGE